MQEEISQSYKNLYPQSDSMNLIYLIQNNKDVHLFCGNFVKIIKKNAK